MARGLASMRLGQRLHNVAVAIGWAMVACVVVLSLSPTLPVEPGDSDKLTHFAAYFVLAAWFAQIYPPGPVLNRITIFLVVLGILLELLQAATGYRSGEWRDAAMNLAGAATGRVIAVTPLALILSKLDRTERAAAPRQPMN